MTISLVMLLFGGCAYVTENDFETWRDAIDQDGDGSPFEVDCDDTDPERFPGNEEVFYDGIDQDCDDFDVVDADSDGHPGIAREDWTGEDNGLRWNADQQEVDCDDNASTTSPSQGSDTPYDGVDQNCDGANDYDLDGDGWLGGGANASDIDDFVAQWDHIEAGAFDIQGPGDCNDSDDAVFPGADDPPYSGADEDCGGEDDFDQDGDGYTTDTVTPSEYATYCAAYPDTCEPGTLAGDCDDDVAEVNPGADEISGNGVDNDCDGNGLDFDLDGYEDCDFSSDPICDCDDTDPLVSPGEIELLGDGIDDDCGEDGDAARWTALDITYERPGRPAVAATPSGWAVGVGALWDGLSGQDNAGHLLAFEQTAPGRQPDDIRRFNTPSRVPGEWVSAEVDGDVGYLSYTTVSGANTLVDLVKQDFSVALGVGYEHIPRVELNFEEPILATAVAHDGAGTIWQAACAADQSIVVRIDAVGDETFVVPIGGDACTWRIGSTVDLEACTPAGCVAHSVSAGGSSVASVSRWPTLDVSQVSRSGVWHAFLVDDGVVLDDGTTSWTLLAGRNVVSVDVADTGAGVAMAVAYRGVNPHVALHHGLPDALVEVPLANDPGGRLPNHVGVGYDGSVVGVFASFDSIVTNDDQLSWAWFLL